MKLTVAVLLLISCTAYGQVYKWTDANGVTHFSSEPPPDNTKSESIEIGPVNSGTIITDRQRRIGKALNADREMEAAFRRLRNAPTRQDEPSGSCKLYRVWLQDHQSELKDLRRRGYTIEEEQDLVRDVEEAKRRVNAFCP